MLEIEFFADMRIPRSILLYDRHETNVNENENQKELNGLLFANRCLLECKNVNALTSSRFFDVEDRKLLSSFCIYLKWRAVEIER